MQATGVRCVCGRDVSQHVCIPVAVVQWREGECSCDRESLRLGGVRPLRTGVGPHCCTTLRVEVGATGNGRF